MLGCLSSLTAYCALLWCNTGYHTWLCNHSRQPARRQLPRAQEGSEAVLTADLRKGSKTVLIRDLRPPALQGTRRRPGKLWSSCSWCCRAPRSSTPQPLAPRSPPTWCVPFGPNLQPMTAQCGLPALPGNLTLISFTMRSCTRCLMREVMLCQQAPPAWAAM